MEVVAVAHPADGSHLAAPAEAAAHPSGEELQAGHPRWQQQLLHPLVLAAGGSLQAVEAVHLGAPLTEEAALPEGTPGMKMTKLGDWKHAYSP